MPPAAVATEAETDATETDAPEAPPGIGGGPGEFTLGDILGGLNEEADAAAEVEEEEESAAPAKPAAKAGAKGAKPAAAPAAKPKVVENQKPEPGQLKEDFSDDRPWTPERVKAAVGEARELARRAQAQWTKESKRSEKLEVRRAEMLREQGQFKAIRDAFAVDFQALRTGDPKTRLAALGRLAGVDGAQLWEELTLEMVQGSKKRELTPGEKALKAELDELKGRLQNRARQEQAQEEDALISQRKAELGELGSDAELYPELSAFEPDEIGEALAEVITRVYNDRKERGLPQRSWRISDAQAAQMLEEDLAKRKAKRDAPQGASGLGTRAVKPAKPEQAQSPPPQRGRSLAPGLSTQSASRRELTDDEIQEDAADFIPASLLRAASPH